MPKGTQLTAYDGPLTIREDNVTIDGKTVTGDLRVLAKNFTIRNSKINGTLATVDGNDTTGARAEKVEVDPGQRQIHAIRGSNWTISRANMHGGQGGVQCNYCTVTDSYIWGQNMPRNEDWHMQGAWVGRDSTFRHNYIACDAKLSATGAGNCTANLVSLPDWEPSVNITVEDNWIPATVDAYYAVYAGSTKGKKYSDGAMNVKYIGNVFERGTSGKGGITAPVRDFDPNRPGAVWRDNTWDDGSPLGY